MLGIAVRTAEHCCIHMHTRTCMCGVLFDLRAALGPPPGPCLGTRHVSPEGRGASVKRGLNDPPAPCANQF